MTAGTAQASRYYVVTIRGLINRLWSPLGALVLAVVVTLALGWWLNARLLAVVPTLVAIMLVGALLPIASIRGLQVSLHFRAHRVREGDRTSVELIIHNKSWLPVLGLHEQQPARNAAMLTLDPVPIVQPRQTVRSHQEITPLRGIYPSTPVRVGTSFPFGLTCAVRAVTCAQPLVVWPRTFPAAPPPELGGMRETIVGVATHRTGSGGDVVGLRPYRRGDSTRWIHWPQSARHGELIVREYQAAAIPRIWIVLDVDPEVHAGVGSAGSREWAIRVAASLAAQWIECGAEIGLCLPHRRIEPRGGRRHAHDLLDALAAIGPADAEPIGAAISALEAVGERSGSVLITTDTRLRIDPTAHSANRIVMLRCAGFFDPAISPAARKRTGPTERVWRTISGPADVPRVLAHAMRSTAHVG